MTRRTYVIRNGELVEKHTARRRSAAPYIQQDGMGQALEHHGFDDGRKTDSRSEFRRWTKEAGCEEMGNDRRGADVSPDKVALDEIREAVKMVRDGYRPETAWRDDNAKEGWH